MKKRNFHWMYSLSLMAVAIIVLTISSCKKDDPEPVNPVASFQFEVSATNFLEVTFTNYSTNATSYAWNFGDGGTSTDKDPVYVYATAGSYEIVLTASNAEGTSATFAASVEITDPNTALALLAGEVSKTWKIFREEGAVGGVFPHNTSL
jgi:uncharacterized membrane protein